MRRLQNGIFLYLASKSERRADILREMGLPFTAVPSHYRERGREKASPELLVQEHALGKACRAALPKNRKKGKREFVLGADTLVCFQEKALGKPRSYREAETTLLQMAGKCHEVYTGVALIERQTGLVLLKTVKTRVRFKRWGLAKIRSYLRRINPLDKAGGYAIQSTPSIAASYEGSFTNVVGLPKESLRQMLRKFPDSFFL